MPVTVSRVLLAARLPWPWAREMLSEFLGTWVLICFGLGSVAQSVLSGRLSQFGDFLSINLGFGIGVLLGVLVAGPISGGHLNPAVSLSMACLGKLSPWKLPHYMLGQYMGAFVGAATVYLTYLDALNHYAGTYRGVVGDNATAGIFATYPAAGVTNLGGGVDQVVGTALLLVCLCAVGQPGNVDVSRSMGPVLAGLVVTNIGLSFGHNAGYAVNPARDLGPRVFTALAGWGTEVFTAHNHWWWVPVVCSHLGGLLGTAIFAFIIKCNGEGIEAHIHTAYCTNKKKDITSLATGLSEL